jgi:hypothetical protein
LGGFWLEVCPSVRSLERLAVGWEAIGEQFESKILVATAILCGVGDAASGNDEKLAEYLTHVLEK